MYVCIVIGVLLCADFSQTLIIQVFLVFKVLLFVTTITTVICIYICVYVCVCMCIYVCIYVCVYVCVYVYIDSSVVIVLNTRNLQVF